MVTGPESKDLPPGIDFSRPHIARMYDYLLGGKDNFAVDRETMEVGLRSWPGARVYARENRKFLGRSVEYLVREAGIRQFLDIGTGLPSANNVHEVAQRFAPDSRVAYVDNDPLVLVHAQALLTSSPAGRTAYVQADLREPEKILGHPAIRDTLDFSQPVALMLVAILHFIPDEDDPGAHVRTLMSDLAPGSYLVSSHLTADLDPEGVHGMEQAYRASGLWVEARSAEDFGRTFFTGLELVDPGLVLISDWRPVGHDPAPSPGEVSSNGAVARKPLAAADRA
jgi:hypothetical protein